MEQTPLTGRRLLEALQDLSPYALDCPVKAWLPGSYIALSGRPFVRLDGPVLLIEGNLEPGSALDDAAATPDLLAALKGLIGQIDLACLVESDLGMSHAADEVRAALAAIAKAEGR